jgi:hypothetical protein
MMSIARAVWIPSLAESVKVLWRADDGNSKEQLKAPALFVGHGEGTVTTGDPARSIVTAEEEANLEPETCTWAPNRAEDGLTVMEGTLPAETMVTVFPGEQAVLDAASVTC